MFQVPLPAWAFHKHLGEKWEGGGERVEVLLKTFQLQSKMTLDYIHERNMLLREHKHKDFASISNLWGCKMHFPLWPLHNGMFAQIGLTCRQQHTRGINIVKKEKHKNKTDYTSDMLNKYIFKT